MTPFLERVALIVWRAVRLRCPNCGSGGLWQTYFRMRDDCPRCGLHLERGEQQTVFLGFDLIFLPSTYEDFTRPEGRGSRVEGRWSWL